MLNAVVAGLKSVWGTAWPIAVAILLFGIVVFIHEFGHFFFAKIFGVKVNEFALGFGPKLLHFHKGETDYSWRLLPFGGFCSMEGEDEDSEDPRAFQKKSVWKRIIIVFAGAFNNIVLGFILAGILLLVVGGFGTTTIHSFASESASSMATGLKTGDRVLSIDGRAVYCSSDISYMLISSEDNIVDMAVERDGEKVDLPSVTFDTSELDGKNYISIDFIVVGEKMTLKHPLTWLKSTCLNTVSTGRMVWMSLYDMVRGRYGLNEISGPVGVVSAVSEAISGETAKQSLQQVLYIISIITINLGIINLLPLPALDGGRIVFLIAEGIRRKPVPAKYEGLVHGIGFALLLVFILIITGSDIIKLFR